MLERGAVVARKIDPQVLRRSPDSNRVNAVVVRKNDDQVLQSLRSSLRLGPRVEHFPGLGGE